MTIIRSLLVLLSIVAAGCSGNRDTGKLVMECDPNEITTATLTTLSYGWRLNQSQLEQLRGDLTAIREGRGVVAPSRGSYRMDADRDLILVGGNGRHWTLMYFNSGVVTSRLDEPGFCITPVDFEKAERIK